MKLAPIDAAARLAGRPGRFLLHSASDADGLGGWSFAGSDPIATLALGGGEPGDPFDAIERFCAAHGAELRADPGPHAGQPPRPIVIGWLGYDLGRPPRGDTAGEDRPPDLWLGAYDAIARWRAGDDHAELVGDHAALAARLAAPGPVPAPIAPRLGPLVAPDDGPGGAAYLARVERILAYLVAGDVYQVNLARRLVAPITRAGDPFALYAAVAGTAPAAYGAFIESAPGATAVISASPERFLARAPGGRVETRPIKGTRPRTGEPAHDHAAARDLLDAGKDAAEHLMIVDLERNDLGRVAVTGSVRVDELRYVVELPTVHHLVSRVSAALRPEVGTAALLRATFPGGSITGAPKIRAMQIIDELEPAPRGPYCGAIGWFGAGGALDLSIAIRIAVVHGDQLRLHVGGGIVADSVPADEFAETEAKAAGWRRALASLAP
jgi:para-aminobenzoate synthetase component 1